MNIRTVELKPNQNILSGNYKPDEIVLFKCNALSESFTVQLPDASSIRSTIFTLNKTDSSSNIITFSCINNQTINGQEILIISKQYESVVILSDGNNFFKINTVSDYASDSDLWDGKQFSDYLDQAVKTTSAPTYTGVTLSDLTEGSVPYVGVAGVLSESENLFWDNTNNRFGIGTNTPSFTQHIVRYGAGLSLGYENYVNSSSGVSFSLRRGRGTKVSPLKLSADDSVFMFFGQQYDGSTVRNCGSLALKVDGTTGARRVPSRWEFNVNTGAYAAADNTAFIVDKDSTISMPNDDAYFKIGASDDAGFLYDGDFVFDSDLNSIGNCDFLFKNGDIVIDSSKVFVVGANQVVGPQQPHIADADGTLADITTKFNTLLAQVETHGLNASS